jgi:signal transduction histidine kinase
MKHLRALIPIVIMLIGAIAIDYLAPWPYIMTPLYAIPVLIAAYRLSPRGVAAIAMLAMVINLMSGLLEGTPLDVVFLYSSGLLITGYLACALARQRQEVALYAGLAEQHAQEVNLAHQRLQEFMAMVVHDLRNPLTAILGSLQVLQQPKVHILPARQQQVLQLSAAAAHSMIRLLDDLRDAGRVGVGHFEIRKSQIDLVEITRRVTALQQTTATNHRFILDAPEHLEGMWDGERLNQLLTNLISNAVKYSPAGSAVQVSVCGGAGEVCVSVADHGIGLDPKQIQQLFQPFVRYNQTIEGLGLGLYISKAIVESHGGRIWVESVPGQGSIFNVALPQWPA